MPSKREKKEKQISSVLQGDEKFLQKILSRNSSVGVVAESYKSVGEVPFQWETVPGTPRNPSMVHNIIKLHNTEEEEEEITIKPVRPPPVRHSGGLSKLRISSKQVKLDPPNSCFWGKNVWKRSKKVHKDDKKDIHHAADIFGSNRNSVFDHSETYLKFSSSDVSDLIRASTTRISSLSSSASSFPFRDDHHAPVPASKLKRLTRKIVNWAFYL